MGWVMNRMGSPELLGTYGSLGQDILSFCATVLAVVLFRLPESAGHLINAEPSCCHPLDWVNALGPIQDLAATTVANPLLDRETWPAKLTRNGTGSKLKIAQQVGIRVRGNLLTLLRLYLCW